MSERVVWWLCVIIEVVCVIVFAIGAAAICSHTFNVRWLGHWFGIEGMAINTGLCFCLMSSALMLTSLIIHHSPRGKKIQSLNVIPERAPLFKPLDYIAIVGLVGSFVLMLVGKSTEVAGVLVVIMGYYFGRAVSKVAKSDGSE